DLHVQLAVTVAAVNLHVHARAVAEHLAVNGLVEAGFYGVSGAVLLFHFALQPFDGPQHGLENGIRCGLVSFFLVDCKWQGTFLFQAIVSASCSTLVWAYRRSTAARSPTAVPGLAAVAAPQATPQRSASARASPRASAQTSPATRLSPAPMGFCSAMRGAATIQAPLPSTASAPALPIETTTLAGPGARTCRAAATISSVLPTGSPVSCCSSWSLGLTSAGAARQPCFSASPLLSRTTFPPPSCTAAAICA